MTVIKAEFRKHFVASEQRSVHQAEAVPTFGKQTGGPGVAVLEITFAGDVISVDEIMRLSTGRTPKLGECVELEREAGMASGHDPVCREFVCRAKVT